MSFEELQNMNQADIVVKLAEAAHDYPQWSQQGKDFIKKLIVLEPLKRMTAKEAVDHDWFRKPARIALELDKLYERSIGFWSKRPNYIGIIEDLPDVLPEVVGPTRSRSSKGKCAHQKFTHKKIPDAASPYFGLERHLHLQGGRTKSSLHSQRKRLLEELKEADSQFINTTARPEQGIATKTARLKSSFRLRREDFAAEMSDVTPSIHRPREPGSADTAVETLASQLRRPTFSVPRRRPITSSGLGVDMYEEHIALLVGPEGGHVKTHNTITANRARPRQPSPETGSSIRQVDACDLFGTVPIEIRAAEAAEAEHAAYEDFQHFLDHEDEEMEDHPAERQEKPPTRSSSVSQDDREMYDEAAKDLPKLSTAKAFPQAIAKRKQLKSLEQK